MSKFDIEFLNEAIRLSREYLVDGAGGPFGAVIVREGKIIAEGKNEVLSGNDPTAHAEIQAIRNACRHLGSFNLEGCEIYSSCEPCPMCLGAIYWSGIKKVVFAAGRKDAAAAGFNDSLIYDEIILSPSARKVAFIELSNAGGQEVFKEWNEYEGKIPY